MTFSASFNPSGGAAIVGLGMTEMTREYTYSANAASRRSRSANAIADAGLTKDDVDGLLINPGDRGDLRADLQKVTRHRPTFDCRR